MFNYKNFTDTHLLSLVQQSDHSAYTEIYNRYFHVIFKHAYKKLRNEAQAKDIVQDIFANLWFNRQNTPSSNLPGYLFTAVRNKIFDLFAHEQTKNKHIHSLGSYLQSCSAGSADHCLREQQFQAYIAEQIRALPPKMRRIFEMNRCDNLSYKEIAKELKVTENNISKQINNALRILRIKLGMFNVF